jgi:dolichyl-diphosphooligosaccharide--protein glycosyltransferase
MKEKNISTRDKKNIFFILALFLTITILGSFLYRSYLISIYSGTVLSDNWWIALNWIKNNTPECAVIATYWDPGHFITGIAERPVVFDGASQNSLRTLTLEGNFTEEEIKNIIGIENFKIKRFTRDGKQYINVTTARIQDIATTLFTDDEEQAIKILKRYLIPNCNNTMYYIASEDLLGKSQWWTYFSTWSPKTKTGSKYFYIPIYFAGTTKIENKTFYLYPLSRQEIFLIYEKENELEAFLQINENITRIKKIIYFDQNSIKEKTYEKYEIDGAIWISPDKKFIIYIQKEIVDSLFTRMFLLNGAGLKHFEFVKNFGGEVKLFKVKFE